MTNKLFALGAGALLLFTTGCKTVAVWQFRDALKAVGLESGKLTPETIAAGLKQALEVGTGHVVEEASRSGGYSKNPLLKIETPEKLQSMASTLRRLGMGKHVDQIEQKMNEAAELAAREAGPVFLDAIRGMTLADAKAILQGGDSAATEYFREKTADALRQRYMPIVEKQMQKLGLIQAFGDLQSKYNQIPMVPKNSLSIESYVTDEALDGLFKILASEEKKIRENPAARTTDLLRRVFGSPQAG